MKLLALSIILSTILVGCGGSSGDTKEVESDPAPIVDVPEPGTEPGDDSSITATNVLLIISDDQGLDASAQYTLSDDIPNTPTLDNLADNGIVFNNAWATPACTTTRASILTGKHGINSGVTYVPAKLDESIQTLPRLLKADTASASHQMAVFGKWHLGGGNSTATHPNDSGVEYYAGNLGNLDDYYNWQLTENGVTSTSNEYHTSKITDLAINWINAQSNPWVTWVAYSAPHAPYHLPPEVLHNRAELTGTSEHIDANKRDYYLAAIEAMDSEIGRLLSSIPTEQLANTVIIYLGDNGTPKGVIDGNVYLKSHAKGSLFEGGIRVPMLVSGYGVERQGVSEAALINSTDIFATISELTGGATHNIYDSQSFAHLLSNASHEQREYNYSEFESADQTGFVVRNNLYKLIQYENGEQQLYDIDDDISETNDLLQSGNNYQAVQEVLTAQADIYRNVSSAAEDITDKIFVQRSANCGDYVKSYSSNVLDVNNSTIFTGSLTISTANDKCVFKTNAIPNHDFNDGEHAFPNDVSAQNDTFEITSSPTFSNVTTPISLQTDNALLLNGVKVDLLAAGCFGVGNGKVGCNDMSQPWRYDPMSPLSGFSVDSHNAHAQPDGTYHYHGTPNAFYHAENNGSASPVVGFAADGFPIYGPYIDDNGTIRKALSSYHLKSGERPSGSDSPGGSFDGTFRDDNTFEQGYGDLDECNGMTVDGFYGYYITDNFPYVVNCFKGAVDPSFNK